MTETLPGWEEIVRRVTIAGSPQRLSEAAGEWRRAHARTKAVYEAVGQLSRRTRGSWIGSGAEAFRAHLAELANSLRSNAEQYERYALSLEACARQLAAAISSIPIPSWLYEEVRTQQKSFNGSVPPQLEPDWFWTTWVGSNMNTVGQVWRGWYEGKQQQAQRIYQELCRAYSEEVASLQGAAVPVPGVTKAQGGKGAPKAGPAKNSPAAKQSAAKTTPPPTTPPPTTPPPGTPTANTPSSTPPVTTDPPNTAELPSGIGDPGTGSYQGPDLKDPGLAGAGGFGGGGGGGAAGLGGLGPASMAAVGAGSPGMGPAVSPPPEALAARPGGAAGAALAGGGMGMAPMMGGAGAGTDAGGQRGGNLFEDDEDIFGTRQASSGVIDT